MKNPTPGSRFRSVATLSSNTLDGEVSIGNKLYLSKNMPPCQARFGGLFSFWLLLVL